MLNCHNNIALLFGKKVEMFEKVEKEFHEEVVICKIDDMNISWQLKQLFQNNAPLINPSKIHGIIK